MEMNRRKRNRETIFCCGIMALMYGGGILFLVLGFLGIDLGDCNSTLLVILFFALSGGIWGILLCRNC